MCPNQMEKAFISLLESWTLVSWINSFDDIPSYQRLRSLSIMSLCLPLLLLHRIFLVVMLPNASLLIIQWKNGLFLILTDAYTMHSFILSQAFPRQLLLVALAFRNICNDRLRNHTVSKTLLIFHSMRKHKVKVSFPKYDKMRQRKFWQ